MSNFSSAVKCNDLIERLEQLYETHMLNINGVPRTNLFQLVQSFNNYMNFTHRFIEFRPFGDMTTEVKNMYDTKVDEFEPMVPEIRVRESPDNKINKMIYTNDGICFRSNREMHKFSEFLEEMPYFSESNMLYWKLMFDERIELNDVGSLTQAQISTMRVFALVRYRVELDRRWINQQS